MRKFAVAISHGGICTTKLDPTVSPFRFILLQRTGLSFVALSLACWLSVSCHSARENIEIISYVVRDRVFVLNEATLKSVIIVGYRINRPLQGLSAMRVKGELHRDGILVSTAEVNGLDSPHGNLSFEFPQSREVINREETYSIPEGIFTIVLTVSNEKGHEIMKCTRVLKRNQMSRTFLGLHNISERIEYVPLMEQDHRADSDITAPWFADSQEGYVVFRKSPVERVFENTEPRTGDITKTVSISLSRNETAASTFSIRALKDLGHVHISVSPLQLRNEGKSLHAPAVYVGAVGMLTEIVERSGNVNRVYYQRAPRIIERSEPRVFCGKTQTYWLTVRAGVITRPGDYYGIISIRPDRGKETKIPLELRVLPFELSDTDIQYGMMMDYAFYELDNEKWSERERELLKQRGHEIYRDLREHGMTVAYPHSHFYYETDANGNPVLDSLRFALKEYKRSGFSGPFCWYLGHLVQTAKRFHPGSVLGYNTEVSKRRLRELLKRYEIIAGELSIAKERLIVQLVDEPDPDDPERTMAGRELNKVARELGFKTLITRAWPNVDVICTGTPDNDAETAKMRQMGKEWWIYPNEALSGKNLSYTRYVFGFGAWRWGVKGVVPWTYQMSQGSNGNPFTVLDGPEVMVAYPSSVGPIPAPTWEVIREGINDYKYIYQLKQLIAAGKAKRKPSAFRIEAELAALKRNLGEAPGPEEGRFNSWPPESFEGRRRQITEWIMELQQVGRETGIK